MEKRLKLRGWRFLDSGFSDCYTNMAVDEAILTAYSAGNSPPTLRIYGWEPEAFSLGYFQDPDKELILERCNSEKIGFVRRITGGGVIFHQDELTYSLVCSKDDIEACNFVKETFKKTCSFLIETYKRLGLEPAFAGNGASGYKSKGGFCSASRERYDILIEGKKIGGNAQKRQRDVIFQHGSIPLRLDMDRAFYFLKKVPGDIRDKAASLEEVTGRGVGFSGLKELILESFQEAFSAILLKQPLTDEEKNLCHNFKEKYRSPQWNILGVCRQ